MADSKVVRVDAWLGVVLASGRLRPARDAGTGEDDLLAAFAMAAMHDRMAALLYRFLRTMDARVYREVLPLVTAQAYRLAGPRKWGRVSCGAVAESALDVLLWPACQVCEGSGVQGGRSAFPGLPPGQGGGGVRSSVCPVCRGDGVRNCAPGPVRDLVLVLETALDALLRDCAGRL